MKKVYLSIAGIVALVISTLFGAHYAYAMASRFIASTYGVGNVTGTSATTTYSWMTPGTGTTTVSYNVPTNANVKYERGWVGVEITATNTPQNSVLAYRVEHSWDGIDYYDETVASSSVQTTGVMAQENRINIATSSNFVIPGLNQATRIHTGFYVEAPTPYNRIVLYSPVGGANLSVHIRVQPIQEVQIINQ